VQAPLQVGQRQRRGNRQGAEDERGEGVQRRAALAQDEGLDVMQQEVSDRQR
jgi:hypothetical protein